MSNNPVIESHSYLKNIQALRGIAALLVLAFHVYAIEGKYFAQHVMPEVIGNFGTCGVDLFFVISGFVMTTVARRQFQSSGSAATFIGRRMMRIYPIYWFYSLIVVAIMLVMPQWVNASSGHRVDIMRSFLLIPSDTFPLLLQGWTLTYEMFFYLVFAALMLCIAERFLWLALVVWSVVTFCVGYWIDAAHVASPVLQVAGSPLVLEFIAGCFCALAWPSIRRPWGTVILVAGIVALAASLLFGKRVGPDTIVQWRTLYFGAPAFLIVLGAVAMEVRSGRIAPRILCLLGGASYSLYLSHVLVISAVGRMYARFAPPFAGPLWGSLLCVVAAVACGWGSFRFIEEPMNGFFKRLLRRDAMVTPA